MIDLFLCNFHNFSQFLGVQPTTVALIQMNSSNAGNWPAINALVAQAKAGGAAIAIFPEGSFLGCLNPPVFEAAPPIPGALTNVLAQMAIDNGIWIAFGMAERGPEVSPSVYLPYDAGVVIDPSGQIVLHSKKYNVLRNAFNPEYCPPAARNPGGGCNYLSSPVSEFTVAETPLGTTAILVCADAYTYDVTALQRVKDLGATAIIVVWGVAAGSLDQCGASGFNATLFARQAALYTNSLVVGANAVGNRPYGRFLPSVYCGNSGVVAGDGQILGEAGGTAGVVFFQVPVTAGG